jgi:hypothetical protein
MSLLLRHLWENNLRQFFKSNGQRKGAGEISGNSGSYGKDGIFV